MKILHIRQPDPGEDLDGRITELKTRKQKLEAMLKLETDIAHLEGRLFLGTSDLIIAARTITEIVATHFKVPIFLINSPSREERIIIPRHISMVLIYELTGKTLSQVGSLFNRDHGTVINALKNVRNRRDTDRAFAAVLASLKTAAAAKLNTLAA